MRTRLLILVSIAIATISGCTSSQQYSSKEQDYCQKLEEFLEFCREQKAKEVIYYGDGRANATEWEEFEKVLCAALGCTPPCESLPDGWQACLTLRQIWPAIEKENIRRITFCSVTDVNNINDWYIRYEVPEKAFSKSVRLLGKALKESEKRGIGWDLGTDVWGINRMKIVTDKGKYIIPVDWTGWKIYGNDWISEELRIFLREYGFDNPK